MRASGRAAAFREAPLYKAAKTLLSSVEAGSRETWGAHVADLHPYDAPERNVAGTGFVLLAAAAGLAFVASKLIAPSGAEDWMWVYAPSVPTFFWALFYVWDRWIWKWRRLGRVPDLGGRYIGHVETDDPVIAPLLGEEAKCEVVITQRWWTMAVAFSSKASTSRSHSARLHTKGTGDVELVYVYYARPRDPTQREQFPAHYGTAVATQPGQRDHQEAYFWTSPWPQHSGRLELHRAGSNVIEWRTEDTACAGTAAHNRRAGIPRVIIDCDPGLDDALALLYLSALHKSAETEIALVTAAAGNVSLEQSHANARHMLDIGGIADVALVPGSARPLVGPAPATGAPEYHGEKGLGPVNAPDVALPSQDEDQGAYRIIETVHSLAERGDPCWLLCLAPLTNFAKALLIDPTIVEAIDRCVIMGGALRHPKGNIVPWAEFNFWWDAPAAKAVLESGLSIRLIPLDATHRVTFGRSDLDEVSGVVHELLQGRIDLHEEATGQHDALVHDAIAALALTDEELFDWRPARVRVAGRGAAGQTEEVRGAEGAEVMVGVPRDAHDIKARFLTVMNRLGSPST